MDQPSNVTGQLFVASKVRHTDGLPFVTLEWGSMRGELTPEQARMLALNILMTAEGAEGDAFFVKYMKERVGFDNMNGVAAMLHDFRKFRSDYHAPMEPLQPIQTKDHSDAPATRTGNEGAAPAPEH